MLLGSCRAWDVALTVLWAAIQQTWEPFVLVVGLLVIGHVAAIDGLFELAGSALSRVPGGPALLFVAAMGLAAIVTATLNLDTSVVFVTPVLLHAARQRGTPERAFLYGSIFMANAASLLLLGSNLTNLLVFSGSGVHGASFAATMLWPWVLAIVLTTVVVLVWCRRDLVGGSGLRVDSGATLRLGPGLVGVVGATVLMIALSRPAVPVLALALLVGALDRAVRERSGLSGLLRSASLPVVGGLFVVATAVSVASRHWGLSEHLVGSAGSWQTAGVAVAASNLMNNLPAAALLSATPPPHPYSLLLGLDLGPNLTVVGTLSSVLWLRVARREGASPSVWTFTKVGVVVTGLTLVGGLLVL